MVQQVDMSSKVVLITGATNGIGKAAARALAKMGAQVIIGGRSREKTAAAAGEVGAADMLLADLSSIREVQRIAEEFKAKYSRLDVLINNAGAYFAKREETVDGFEKTFALNHLAYFVLTTHLLDTLKTSAPARIINVSSDAHRSGPMKLDDLQSAQSYGGVGFVPYGQSKLANILFTYELARRLAGTGVTANAMHPGFVASGFARSGSGLMNLLMGFLHRFALTPEQGAETVIYLASSPDVEGVTGQYFDKCKPVRTSEYSYDEAAARRLWELSEQMAAPVLQR